uniref:HAT C-terminal dimerisation domain-containing protein n=1 Tax=Chenopodium quinoa TaxID=63459 RepID=A0A803N3Y2_CHEQI
MKSELKLYLEEKNLEVTVKCDVLAYWSKSMVRYPTLAIMVRDILTIPILTVPSESAFRMGKKSSSTFFSFGELAYDDEEEEAGIGVIDEDYVNIESHHK